MMTESKQTIKQKIAPRLKSTRCKLKNMLFFFMCEHVGKQRLCVATEEAVRLNRKCSLLAFNECFKCVVFALLMSVSSEAASV